MVRTGALHTATRVAVSLEASDTEVAHCFQILLAALRCRQCSAGVTHAVLAGVGDTGELLVPRISACQDAITLTLGLQLLHEVFPRSRASRYPLATMCAERAAAGLPVDPRIYSSVEPAFLPFLRDTTSTPLDEAELRMRRVLRRCFGTSVSFLTRLPAAGTHGCSGLFATRPRGTRAALCTGSSAACSARLACQKRWRARPLPLLRPSNCRSVMPHLRLACWVLNAWHAFRSGATFHQLGTGLR